MKYKIEVYSYIALDNYTTAPDENRVRLTGRGYQSDQITMDKPTERHAGAHQNVALDDNSD